jgi:hypothetical protein
MMLVLSFAMLSSTGAAATMPAASFLRRGQGELKYRFEGAVFMIISGSTAPAEMCLAAETGVADAVGVEVTLQPCAASIAAGDGRELFGFEDGHLISIPSRACVTLSANETLAGGRLVLGRCSCLLVFLVQ